MNICPTPIIDIPAPLVGARTSNSIGKRFAKCLKDLGLTTNQKIINYLDVTFDLNNGSYKPNRKPDNTPLYRVSQKKLTPLLFI
jgi:hypothetical protein